MVPKAVGVGTHAVYPRQNSKLQVLQVLAGMCCSLQGGAPCNQSLIYLNEWQKELVKYILLKVFYLMSSNIYQKYPIIFVLKGLTETLSS